MNADTYTGRDRSRNSVFGRELLTFCDDNNFVLSDVKILAHSDDAFTYVSDVTFSASWLDHCVATHAAHSLISDISISDKFAVSDHLPLCINIKSEVVSVPDVDMYSGVPEQTVRWSSVSERDKTIYTDKCNDLLQAVDVPIDVLLCNDVSCTLISHKHTIDYFYNHITDALREAGMHICKSVSEHQHHNVPGWNEYCCDAHDQARDAFHLWRGQGKPKQGPAFDFMKRSRALFKYALKYCKKNEQQIIADKLAGDLTDHDYVQFWKQVGKLNGKHMPLSNTVGGATGSEQITSMWKEHFCKLLSSGNENTNDLYHTKVNHYLSETTYSSNYQITPAEINKCILSLKSGKANGPDGLAAEHFKLGGNRLPVFLSLILSCMSSHGYIPNSFMRSIIIPLVKDKTGDITDKNNYRPIALSTMSSKILERVIMNRYDQYFTTTDNQFGFKTNHSTDMCVYSLKEIVNIYRNQSSPIFICFLYASKAFDKINYWLLFYKLIRRDLPLYIVRILSFWYMHQQVCVQWGGAISDLFHVLNGVRQGGILSPLFFNIYMNDLSMQLNMSDIGCNINGIFLNHFVYADDMCIVAPCANALQLLLNICMKYAGTHDITYNIKKSVCMYMKSSKFNLRVVPRIYLNGNVLQYVNTYKYLGCILSNDLKDDNDIKKTIRGIYARSNMLIRRFYNCSSSVKKLLFKTYCTNFLLRPTMVVLLC